MSGLKMLVTDLDGTLLREDKTVSGRSLSALKRCRAAGIKVVYATGRGSSAKALVPAELFDGYVCMNGATAYIGDTRIHERLIPIDDVRDLLIAADDAGYRIVAESGGTHYGNFNVSEKWPWLPDCELTDFRTLDIKVEKVYAVVESPEITELISRYLSDEMHMYVSRDDLAMIMHKEAVKSKAVGALAEHWGIAPEDVVAFGDDTNDIEMLEHCGTGVAMGNALDEVKAAADQVCDTNDNDGMAKWLEANAL